MKRSIIFGEEISFEYAFSTNMDSMEAWTRLSHRPKDRIFSNTTCMKIVVQHFVSKGSIVIEPIVYFLDSSVYPYHHNFVSTLENLLENVGYLKPHSIEDFRFMESNSLNDFNLANYENYPRQYTLLTLCHYEDSNIFAVELWPSDNLPAEGILSTFSLIKSQVFFADRFRWRAASLLHEENLKVIGGDFYSTTVIDNSILFKDLVYQPLFMGETIGKVKIWKNTIIPTTLKEKSSDSSEIPSLPPILAKAPSSMATAGGDLYTKDDILVAEDLPIDLNPLRGLVTQQMQTPLCHVALLCSNRETPNMSLKNALEMFSPFENKLVYLHVGPNEYSLRLATEAEEKVFMSQALLQKKSKKVPLLKLHKDRLPLLDLKDLTKCLPRKTKLSALFGGSSQSITDIQKCDAIGAKALNLTKLMSWKLQQTNTIINDLSFVIPFYFFQEFVNLVANGEIALLQKATGGFEELCSSIRKKIRNGHIPLDWDLKKMLLDKFKQWRSTGLSFSHTKMNLKGGKDELFADGYIFRSSTNCEDLEGFPSAGLYLSEKVELTSSEDEWEKIERAVLRVWASTYLDKAFLERKDFGIKEEDVCMAVLVMPLLSSCIKANGVAVTANPYRPDFGGIVINIQLGTTAVTDNAKGTIAEQVVFIRERREDLITSMDFMSSSSLMPKNEHIINSKVAPIMENVFNLIGDRYRYGMGHDAADIEFLLLKNDELVILQARPVKVQNKNVDLKSLHS